MTRPLVFGRRVIALALALAASLAAGCPGPSFEHFGPATRAGAPRAPAPMDATGPAEALPPPRLEVEPPRPVVGWLPHASVLAHEALPGGAHRLLLRTEEDEEVRVVYALGGGRALPVAPGAAVRVRYYPARPAEGHRGDALVLADTDGEALALIVRYDGLPAGVLPGEMRVERGGADHEAYVDVHRTASLCLARVEHSELGLASEGGWTWVPPGRVAPVTVAGRHFDFIVYDASRPLGQSCGPDDPSHLSWALLRAAAGAGAGPAP